MKELMSSIPEKQPRPPQTFKMESFAAIVTGFPSLTIFVILFILDTCGDLCCAFV